VLKFGDGSGCKKLEQPADVSKRLDANLGLGVIEHVY
jgi:hypothetical protein